MSLQPFRAGQLQLLDDLGAPEQEEPVTSSGRILNPSTRRLPHRFSGPAPSTQGCDSCDSADGRYRCPRQQHSTTTQFERTAQLWTALVQSGVRQAAQGGAPMHRETGSYRLCSD